jgi:ATP-dependent protease HslVU (ClpYQ) ATPase subunit
MSGLENLRKLIVETKSHIELNASEQTGAEELMQELSGLVKSLKDAKTQASELTVGEAASPEKAKTLDSYLNTAERLIDKAQQFGEKVAELSIKLAPVALPLLTGIRALLKL